jgi:hypothetical protein
MLGIEPANEPLDRKVFNEHFDNLLKTGKLNPDILPLCSASQQMCYNEVKKALKRINKENERSMEFIKKISRVRNK